MTKTTKTTKTGAGGARKGAGRKKAFKEVAITIGVLLPRTCVSQLDAGARAAGLSRSMFAASILIAAARRRTRRAPSRSDA